MVTHKLLVQHNIKTKPTERTHILIHLFIYVDVDIISECARYSNYSMGSDDSPAEISIRIFINDIKKRRI